MKKVSILLFVFFMMSHLGVMAQLVSYLPLLENDAELHLPMGVYVLTSSSRRIPVKVVAR